MSNIRRTTIKLFPVLFPVLAIICVIVFALYYKGCDKVESMDNNKNYGRYLSDVTPEKVAGFLSNVVGYTVSPEYVHLLAVEGFPGVIVVGEHVTTHGAALRGVFVENNFGTPDEMVKKAMALAGWDKADKKKARLAFVWAEKVLYEFSGYICTEGEHVFGTKSRPEFSKPESNVLPDGTVLVTFWMRNAERDRSSTRTYRKMKVLYNTDGNIIEKTSLNNFSVPITEIFKRRKGPV